MVRHSKRKVPRFQVVRGRVLSPKQAMSFFNKEVKLTLGIPGNVFIRRFKSGETKNLNPFEVYRLASLIPLARQKS
jgi:hypothetical protein